MERRSFTAGELRLDRADGKSKVGGYAARFNSESLDLGGFVERIAPGAFSRALQAGADVRALLNHNSDIVLGRSKSGTLRLAEDANGLAFELDLPDTQAGRDLAVLIERRDIAEMSFGFKMRKDQWAKLGPDQWLRTLLDVDLLDVSPVAYPAYPSTEVGMRSAVAVDAVAGLAAAKAADEARGRRLALLERSVRT